MRNIPSLKGKATIYGILLLILGFLHFLIPVWGIVVPDIGFSFFWYWGFYIAGSSGSFTTGTVTLEDWLIAGRTAMTLMIVCFVILTITLILAKTLKTFETEKNINIFGIVWLITGILMLIAPSIYLTTVSDSIFDEYTWPIGIFFSYGLASLPLLLGSVILYSHMKGEKVGT